MADSRLDRVHDEVNKRDEKEDRESMLKTFTDYDVIVPSRSTSNKYSFDLRSQDSR